MKKEKIYRKEIEFQTDGSRKDIFDSFDEEYLKNEFGFYKFKATGVEGFTVGSPPNPFRFEGEGLPAEKDSNSHHKEFNFNFDVRLSHDGKGNIEFLVAQKRTRLYFKYQLKNLTPTQAEVALFEFENRMNTSYISNAIYRIAWACYRRQDEDKKNRKESLKKILDSFKAEFESLLEKTKKEKVVKEIEKDGYKITEYAQVEGGRNKGAKNKEPSITIKKIKAEISSFKYSVTFPTQTIVARRLKTTARTIQRCIKNAGITTKYNDFVHSILMEK